MSSELNNCPNCGIDFNEIDIYDYFFLKYTIDNGYKYPTTVSKVKENAEAYPSQYLPLPDNLDSMTQNELDAWNSARMYGWTFEKPRSFRKEVGIEIDGSYDGVEFWHCPECKYTWKRFEWSNLELLKEQDWAKDFIYEISE